MKKIAYLNNATVLKFMVNTKPYIKNPRPFKLSSSALIVVDMQDYFLNENSHAYVPSSPFVVERVMELVNFYRTNNRPIIFTYFAEKVAEVGPVLKFWGNTVKDGSDEAEILTSLTIQSDKLLRKPSYNAFYNTELEEYLKSLGVENVLISGLLTNVCCETTARGAFNRNFDVFFPIDSTATYNEEMHQASLINLAYCCVTLLTSDDILGS